MKIRSITALIPALLFACGGAESPTGPGDASGVNPVLTSAESQQILLAQVASASITLNEAIDSALAANPGSRVLGADLDGTDADVRFEVELALADESVVEVHVDAKTGDIVSTLTEDEADDIDEADEADDDADDQDADDGEVDDEDDADDEVEDDADETPAVLACVATVSAQDALQIAETETSGTAVEVEIDPEDCEFEVIVQTAAGFVEVDVAPDGTVAEVDDGQGDDADDADDDDGEEDDADDGDD